LKKTWGLFGGKWEAKMVFGGHCGKINDPNDLQYS